MAQYINQKNNYQKDILPQSNESEEYFENFISRNECENEEDKSLEMDFNLNNYNYNKSFKDKNNENNKEENTSQIETCSSTLKEKNQIEITLYITNICGTSNLNCRLNLEKIVKKTLNSEYNPKKNNFLKMKLKEPKSHASIFSSGKLTCTGVKSEEQLKKAIIKYDKIIKSCGFSTKLNLDEIVINNISATFDFKFMLPLKRLYYYLGSLKETGVKLHYFENSFPAMVYYKKVDNSNMRISFFTSGKINITGARKKEDISIIINQIYP